MFTLPLGIIAVILVTFFSLESQDLSIYLNKHSFIIVVLGTFGVFIFSNPMKDIKTTMKGIWNLFGKEEDNLKLKEKLLKISNNRKEFNAKDFEQIPLLKYALELWEQGIDKENFEDLVKQKYDDLAAFSELPVLVLKNLSKYPPALGMTGTVMGMIALFSKLNAENKDGIGLYLAVAMTATFYGLIFANMILLPLADRVLVKHQTQLNRNEIILNAIIKINNHEPASLIEGMNLEQKYVEQAG